MDAILLFVVQPTIIATKLHYSMLHLDYNMHQSIDMSVDLEVEVEVLCSIKCMDTKNKMKQWDDLPLKKY